MDGGGGMNGSNVLQEHQQHATHQHMDHQQVSHPQVPGGPQQAAPQPQHFMQQGHRVPMGRRLTARDLPRLAECEALFAMAKVDPPMGEMAPMLEALNHYLKQQEHDVAAGMQEYMQWSSKQVEQKVRELENLAYRLGLDEDVQIQKAHEYKIFG